MLAVNNLPSAWATSGLWPLINETHTHSAALNLDKMSCAGIGEEIESAMLVMGLRVPIEHEAPGIQSQHQWAAIFNS